MRNDQNDRRIAVISVYYYRRYLKQGLSQMAAICDALNARVCVVVSNNPDLMPHLIAKETGGQIITVTHLHDNSGLEFGAYQAGIECVQRIGEPDWLVITNDTLSVHQCYSSPLRRNFIQYINQTPDIDTPIIVGQVESLPRSYALDGMRTHRWVTTNGFAINRAALRVLGYRVYHSAIDSLIKPSNELRDFFSPKLDPVLKDHLAVWLFECNGPLSWYDAAPLDCKNATKHAEKARSILQEKYVSARLESVSAIFSNIKEMPWRDRIVRRAEENIFSLRRRLRF